MCCPRKELALLPLCIPFWSQVFVAGPWCGHTSVPCGLCCCTLCEHSPWFFVEVGTQNAGTDGRGPPGLQQHWHIPGASFSKRHKTVVLLTMKSWKQVVLFAGLRKRKKTSRGKCKNKSAFYFLWYSEIGVESSYKPLEIKEAAVCQSQVGLAPFWIWLEQCLNCFSNFTSLSEIVHLQNYASVYLSF